MLEIFLTSFHTSFFFINYILIFSNTLEEQLDLLDHFNDLVKQYGVMLSENIMNLMLEEINFLEMHFFHGSYTLRLHICQDLLKFRETNFLMKHLQ